MKSGRTFFKEVSSHKKGSSFDVVVVSFFSGVKHYPHFRIIDLIDLNSQSVSVPYLYPVVLVVGRKSKQSCARKSSARHDPRLATFNLQHT
jgi:hypothetical protein